MKSIQSSSDMARLLASPIDPDLRHLLALRRDQLLEFDGYDIGELANFFIADSSTTILSLEAAIGVPLVMDGAPWWEHCQRHGRWIELTFILSDDGFGVACFIRDDEQTDRALLALINEHA